MSNLEKMPSERRVSVKYTESFIKNGIFRILHSKSLFIPFTLISIFYLSFVFYYIKTNNSIFSNSTMVIPVAFAFTALYIIVLFLVSYTFGKPYKYNRYRDAFESIGFINDLGETPYIYKKTTSSLNDSFSCFIFYSPGLSIENWTAHKSAIENALNVHLIDISQALNNQYIRVTTVSGDVQLPDYIPWNPSYYNSGNDDIVLGMSVEGPVRLNLQDSPHMMIAGATGSGKSVLMRCILGQCAQKGYSLYLVVKKRSEITNAWLVHLNVLSDIEEVKATLHNLVAEMYRRDSVFKEHGVRNMWELNEKLGMTFHRIVFAIDEAAELLDSTGLSKDEKKDIDEVQGLLSTLARLGRSAGISLLIGCQRGSADVFSGQLRNNLTYRCCGRADNNLSILTLDNGDAADKISKLAKGRFLDTEGRLFQAFNFTDSDLY